MDGYAEPGRREPDSKIAKRHRSLHGGGSRGGKTVGLPVAEVFCVQQCEREEQHIGSPVLHWRGVAPPKVPGHVHQVIFNILEIDKDMSIR